MTGRRGAAGVLFLVTAGALCLGFILVLGAMMGSEQDDSGCTGSGESVLPASASKVGGLTPAQLANAGTVIAEGRRRQVPTQAVVIALAVASQESRFTNYANDGRGSDLDFFQKGIEKSLWLPHEAVGTDHGSLGVFQQQWPWWGSMADLMNPARAAGKFYAALLKVPGWRAMPVTVAAQRVQRSAFPDAYADDESLARQLLGDAPATEPVDASFTAPSVTCASSTDPGRVAFPLPRGATYVDNRNWGGHGAHW